MLENFVAPQMLQHQCLDSITFMQDGAPPHIVLCVQQFLRQHFTNDRVISRAFPTAWWGCGSPVVKVSNRGRHVMSSIAVSPKTRRVGQRCTLNLSRAETSSRWCGVVVRRGGCRLRCRPRHLTMVQNYVVRRQKPSCS
ncbi:uncharacterized protein TNCV_4136871 [Trichonephila clavipes]|nr:uncharacterized protein TNCV_4136871 [Trichonephila clavipes]